MGGWSMSGCRHSGRSARPTRDSQRGACNHVGGRALADDCVSDVQRVGLLAVVLVQARRHPRVGRRRRQCRVRAGGLRRRRQPAAANGGRGWDDGVRGEGTSAAAAESSRLRHSSLRVCEEVVGWRRAPLSGALQTCARRSPDSCASPIAGQEAGHAHDRRAANWASKGGPVAAPRRAGASSPALHGADEPPSQSAVLTCPGPMHSQRRPTAVPTQGCACLGAEASEC